MKNIALILFLCVNICHAQHQYPSPFEFQVIDTATGTKSELYSRANEWVVNTFKNAKEVIQLQDKDGGKIIAKGIIESPGKVGMVKGMWYIKFTLGIDLKDGRYRIKLFNFIAEGCQSMGSFSQGHYFDLNYSLNNEDAPNNGLGSYGAKTWDGVKMTCYLRSEELAQSLIKALNSKSSDW